jgi:hypothetical protein
MLVQDKLADNCGKHSMIARSGLPLAAAIIGAVCASTAPAADKAFDMRTFEHRYSVAQAQALAETQFPPGTPVESLDGRILRPRIVVEGGKYRRDGVDQPYRSFKYNIRGLHIFETYWVVVFSLDPGGTKVQEVTVRRNVIGS